jgi:phenylalanyl-tRNA synthetase beta chain
MKFSLNIIRELNTKYKSLADNLDFDIVNLSQKIGAQLGAIEEIIDLGKKYDHIVIAKVIASDKHPDADRLHVCLIDDGGVVKDVLRNEEGLVQVVCGAPNVRPGLVVAWLPPGSIVPETIDKQPLKLEAKEIRGVVSNGMLASPKELGIGDNHDGILEIDGEHAAGEDFATAFAVRDDKLIDVENKMFTHRPDCFGFLGIARELAGISQVKYTSPDWYKLTPVAPKVERTPRPFNIINDLPDLVPRFCAISLSDIEIKPSPVWLQLNLAKVGVRPINNLVDLTNWLMLETGQPLHAYDYDKLKALSSGDVPTIMVRRANQDETLLLLNGKTLKLRQGDIVIASDQKAIGLGGIMGGAETEVDASTKNVVIECATFDMYAIRRSSMDHGLFSDAATRFTKGQSPLQNPAVILQMVKQVQSLVGGKVASELIDNCHLDKTSLSRGSLHPPVTLEAQFINLRLGLQLTATQIKQLLENVEFKVELKGDSLSCEAPFWRTDIELPEDIVEEVGRLYGYDKLPLKLPSRDLQPASKNALVEAKNSLRLSLSRLGANEVLTYSFVDGALLDKVGQDKAKAYEVANALRPELQYYRMSLMPSLLDKVHTNIKAGYNSFALFELAKLHEVTATDETGLPLETEVIGFIVAKADKLNDQTSPYFLAKRYLSTLTKAELDFKALDETAQSLTAISPYEPSRSAMVYSKSNNQLLGIVGEFKTSVRKQLKLPRFTAGFELDLNNLAALISQPLNYQALSRFPKVVQDMSFQVDTNMNYQTLVDALNQSIDHYKPDDTLFQLSPKDIYQGDDKQHKSITLSLSMLSHHRTLTDQEVNSVLDKVAKELKSSIDAQRR